METDELKNIWKTLSKQKLINEELAKENIERIISQKSSNLMIGLSKKLKIDYIINVSTVFLLITIIVLFTFILNERYQEVPIQGFVFFLLTIGFFIYRALNIKSQINLINLTYNTSTILESLKRVKNKFIREYRKEATISCIVIGSLTSFANILLIDNTDLSGFTIYSLTGFIMVFSVLYLISLPWLSKLIFRRRFSNIVSDLDNTIQELDMEKSHT